MGATLSDHGYVIISMFFDAELLREGEDSAAIATAGLGSPKPGRVTTINQPDGSTVMFQDEREWGPYCEDRANNGYNSGMGEIFRKVCAISPISEEALALSLPPGEEPSCDITKH